MTLGPSNSSASLALLDTVNDIDELIDGAEQIDGLPFVLLQHLELLRQFEA